MKLRYLHKELQKDHIREGKVGIEIELLFRSFAASTTFSDTGHQREILVSGSDLDSLLLCSHRSAM